MKTITYYIKIVSLIFASQLLSCTNKSELRKSLETKCFWDMLDRRYTEFPNSTYKFYDNGIVDYFNYVFLNRNKTDTIELASDGDNIRPKKWNLEGDTILNMRGYRMKVLRYTSDSIFANFYNHNDLILFIKNCKQITIVK